MSGGFASHTEGEATRANGDFSHAEGHSAKADGYVSHAEGYNTTASGDYSHAEGRDTTASGNNSHAEGESNTASGHSSHAEGNFSHAEGNFSHAEGYISHAEGYISHAEGYRNTACGRSQHVQGEFNIKDRAQSKLERAKYAHIVGNGTSESNLSNAHALDWQGNAYYAGDVYVQGDGTNDFADAKKLATEESVEAVRDSIPTKVSDLTNDAGYATETYVNNKVAGLVDSAPETLDTLNELAAALGDDPNFATTVVTEIGKKVDKEDGKGLSTNDYTTEEKTKLAGIAEGAEANVQSDFNETDETSMAFIKNKPTKDDALLLAVETELIDPITDENGAIYTDLNGEILSL